MSRRVSSPMLAGIMVAGVVAALLAVGIAVPASASSDGLWYVDALKVRPHHAAGITGDGVKIAVIDGQINPDIPTLRGTDLQVREPSFCFDDAGTPLPATSTALSTRTGTEHGTNVVSMILGSGAGYSDQTGVIGVAPAATVLYYAVFGAAEVEGDALECLDQDGHNADVAGLAILEALDSGADIISVSMMVGATDTMVSAMARAYREGVPIVAGLRNSTQYAETGMMPGLSNGAVSVQAAGPTGEIQGTDGVLNKTPDTDIVAPGVGLASQGNPFSGSWEEQGIADGTSFGTPIVAGILSLVKQKYPAATGNQLIQSLIRNTSGEPDHEPYYDPDFVYGYGLISVDNLLSVDPTGYPDVNPLIKEVQGDWDVLIPTYDQIFNPENATDPTEAPGSVGNEADNNPDGPVVTAIIAGAIGLFVLLLVVVIILVKRKSRDASNGGTSTGTGE